MSSSIPEDSQMLDDKKSMFELSGKRTAYLCILVPGAAGGIFQGTFYGLGAFRARYMLERRSMN